MAIIRGNGSIFIQVPSSDSKSVLENLESDLLLKPVLHFPEVLALH
jgi:hypothetical protein